VGCRFLTGTFRELIINQRQVPVVEYTFKINYSNSTVTYF